ncbi:hypothetical protein BOW49_07780 [Solemya velum gill symbiont]|uniref:HyaD/HybD family hydrogenase maturation endopeptidase n=1 Tax=Solemya velum gill symbiont TaxID=2340 RepID=UPI000996E083|nr:HyaD/HybD family hydrogenase maturation endopeptidase [Solemya velum gill symbiont]OOZ73736.1 hypothetical protein BOW49_07780 [Solemya velum gill symbiont]
MSIDKETTLILGVGNTLLTDEGAGIHALNHLESLYPDTPHLTFLDGGTLSFTLAAYIEECNNLIVFDAAELHQPAGSVSAFVGEEMDEFLGRARRSAHEVALLDLVDIARLTGHMPEHRALIGIQPETIEWGMEPSDVVRAGIDKARDEAVTLIEQWHPSGEERVATVA